MPRGGSKPGERRGGRQKGSLNKLTIGRMYRELHGYDRLDGKLELLRWALEVAVPDLLHRQQVGKAIDDYIDAREKASDAKRKSPSAVAKPQETWKSSLEDIRLMDVVVADFDPQWLLDPPA